MSSQVLLEGVYRVSDSARPALFLLDGHWNSPTETKGSFNPNRISSDLPLSTVSLNLVATRRRSLLVAYSLSPVFSA